MSGTLTTGNLTFNGAISTDRIIQANGGSPVELFDSTTTSPIYFGGGASYGPQHTTGPIIIGCDSTATGGINIGTGTDLTAPLTNTVNIGSATYGTNIKGTLGITGSTTVASGSNITLTSGNLTCTAGQLIAPTVRNGANTGSISSAGVITGTSIVSASYGPASDATDVSFCATQTGIINIGTATRTTSGKFINIGNGINSTNQINIGVSTNTTAIQGTIDLGTTSDGKGINIGTATSTTTIDGLITSDTNTRYLNSTTTATIPEYLNGGITMISHNNAGDFNLGTTRLNKTLNVIFTGNQVQTFTFPSSPVLGQIINLRSGKTGGSITLPAVGSNVFFASNVNLAGGSSSASIILPIVSTSSWLYYEANKWIQITDSIHPLVDTAAGTTGLSIGSTLVNGNIAIGAALGVGSIALGGAQTTGDINIGVNSASDIYIGNAASGTAVNTGVCHINKAQIGTNGSVCREMRFGTAGANSVSGSVSFTPAMISSPIITTNIISNSSTQTFSVNIHTVSTTGFSYVKNWIYNNGTAGGNPVGESFYWIAISP